jgi:hypothetical protein
MEPCHVVDQVDSSRDEDAALWNRSWRYKGLYTHRNRVIQGVFTNTYNKPYPKVYFFKTSRCEKPFKVFKKLLGVFHSVKPYWVGFAICVGEEPLKNPYF